MSRRLRRDLNKRIPSAGYQKISGDLEVTGLIMGPSVANIVMAITKLVAGTTTPVKLTITHCDSVYKGIVIHWDRQYNLANFDHYEIQVSADQTNWYSLKLDGTGWQGTLDAVTSTPDNFIPHSPIPFGGTAEEPTAIRLYYRVRQATILGVEGAWSDTANATTSLIETGDIAARSIAATKMIVGELSARELAFGAEEGGVSVYDDAEAAVAAAEIFDLSQPDCVGSNGTRPEAGKETVFAPGVSIDENGREFRGLHSPRMFGQSEAMFQTATNLIQDPEDLTTANWTLTNATAVSTAQYVNGCRLTKVMNSGASYGYASQTYTTAFTQVDIAVQTIIRKGVMTDDKTYFRLVDVTDANNVIVNMTIDFDNYPNSPGTPSAGTLQNYTWIDENTVQLQLIGTLAAAGNDAQVVCRAASNVAGDYSYWTAVQLEDLPYPTPYIDNYRYPTGVRTEMNPEYAVTMPEKFVFKVKIRPWFTYDTSIYHKLLSWYVDANSYFYVQYGTGSDLWAATWRDDGSARQLQTQQFDDGSSHDDLNSEIILYGQIDLSTQEGNNKFFAIVDGVKQTEDTAFNGVPDSKSATFSTLEIGHRGGGAHADSLIEYVKIWTWDGASLGTISDETDIDRVTADLTSLFSETFEDYSSARPKPDSKHGAIGIFQATENLIEDPEDLATAGANWTGASGSAAAADDYINGKRFTTLTTSGVGGRVSQTLTPTAVVHSGQCILKRGTETASTSLQYWDDTGGGNDIRINLGVNWATQGVSLGTGSNLEYQWINRDTVWIAATTSAALTANPGAFSITTATDGATVLITACQLEAIAYPTPYTPTERKNDGVLDYKYEMPEKFSFSCWVRPWFPHDTATWHRFFEWYVGANDFLLLAYNVASDYPFLAWKQTGGTERWLIGPALDGGGGTTDVNQWLFIAGSIDLSARGQTASRLKVYSESGGALGEDTDWGAAPDAKITSHPTLSIGHAGSGTTQADSFFSDLMIYSNELMTEEDMDRHYNKRRPWYSISEVASNDKKVRIDRHGIRLHNAELNITDWLNRQILISNRDGMKALDAAGNPIHDIPNAPTQINEYYLGHTLWFQDLSKYKIYDDTNPTVQTWTDVTCLTGANSNIKAGIFKVYGKAEGASTNLARVDIFLRPKGTSWVASHTSNAPVLITYLESAGNDLDRLLIAGMLICPIGTDNKIQFYVDLVPTDMPGDRIVITQLGALI